MKCYDLARLSLGTWVLCVTPYFCVWHNRVDEERWQGQNSHQTLAAALLSSSAQGGLSLSPHQVAPMHDFTKMVGEGDTKCLAHFLLSQWVCLLHKITDGPSWKLGLDAQAVWLRTSHLTSFSSRQLEITVPVAHNHVLWIKWANADEVLNTDPVICLNA